ncbi:Endocytosis and vacuole integrity protein [Tritrichomonas musculus]|uniref:Endocytosis and vacuole integrity protein n=1 Tax=Tritrichomonas musculus TaxID=1915356 RepID=A0ABR2JGZ7_9EUKA
MEAKYITELKNEYKKYSRFMVPEVVRTPSNEAITALSDSSFSFPIENSQHPIITAFWQILENKKTNKTSASLINLICDCLRQELIIKDALSSIVRKFETFTEIEDETALKIINIYTTIIGKHFLDMDVFLSILSFIASLCSSQSILVSTSSIAALNQVISSFLTFSEETGDNLTPENQRNIDLCYSMSGDENVQFAHRIDKIIFLILRDFVQISIGKPSQWLRITNLKSDVSYNVLTNVITEHFELLKARKIFQRQISVAMTYAYARNAPLSFCILSVEYIMNLLPKGCGVIFSAYVRDIRKESPRLQNALVFFRIFLFRNLSIVVNFCLKCDQNANLLSAMIAGFRMLMEDVENDPDIHKIDLSLSPRNPDWLPPPRRHSSSINSSGSTASVERLTLRDATSGSASSNLSKNGSSNNLLKRSGSSSSLAGGNPEKTSIIAEQGEINIPSLNGPNRLTNSEFSLAPQGPSLLGQGTINSLNAAMSRRALSEMVSNDSDSNVLTVKLTSQGIYSGEFNVSAPIEVSIFFVVSCYKAANNALKILVSRTWADLLYIFQVAASVVSGKSCYHLMQGLHSLVVLTNELMLDDARASAINTFCSILVETKGPESDEVTKTAYLTVSSAIETAPSVFKDNWNKLITVLARFLWRPQNFKFTQNLPLKQIIEIIQSLFSVNDGNVQISEWSNSLLADIILANISKFKEIWSEVEEPFLLEIINSDTQNESLNAFFEIIKDGFTKESEKQLCVTIDKLLSGNYFDPETRGKMLSRIHSLLSQNGRIVNEGWPELLNSLSPKNFEDDVDCLHTSFNCLQLICSDILFSLGNEVQMKIIDLSIAFVNQQTDINVSLSASGLLWNLSSVAKTPDQWKRIFKLSYPLIGDLRNDVSLCAVNTFFSLLISNSATLDNSVIKYVIGDLSEKILDILVEDRPDNESTQQSAFHELVHCASNLWSQISEVVENQEKIWARMITEHEKFVMRCKKQEIVIASLLFYEEIFQCENFTDDLFILTFDSLDRIIQFFIENNDPNSPIYGSLGKMIRVSLPAMKKRMNMTFLKRWLNIIEKLIFELESGPCLPPTAHKSLDALDLLFPLDTDLTLVLYESLVRIASSHHKKEEEESNENNRLAEVAVDHMCLICKKKVPQEILATLFIMSKSLFKLKEARKLVLDFVSSDIPVNDDMVENISHSLMELGRDNPDLAGKTANIVLNTFLKTSDETKIEFINSYSNCYKALFGLWLLYLNPESSKFDENTAKLCTAKVVEKLEAFLDQRTNDNKTIFEVLKFVSETPTLGSCFNAANQTNSDFAHIYSFLPQVADLVFTEDDQIKYLVRNVILVVYKKQLPV